MSLLICLTHLQRLVFQQDSERPAGRDLELERRRSNLLSICSTAAIGRATKSAVPLFEYFLLASRALVHLNSCRWLR